VGVFGFIGFGGWVNFGFCLCIVFWLGLIYCICVLVGVVVDFILDGEWCEIFLKLSVVYWVVMGEELL